jgi:hypothetical protein
MPLLTFVGAIRIYIKYAKEDVIRENVNCHLTYIAPVGSCSVRIMLNDVHRSRSTKFLCVCPCPYFFASGESSGPSSIRVDGSNDGEG